MIVDDAYELPDQIADAVRRARFGSARDAGANAYALGTLEALLGQMYARHGIPQSHRDLLEKYERESSDRPES